MPSIRPDQPLVPSVLDRLMDDDPGHDAEAARNRSQLLRELKASVRRDLENLLNTRRRDLVIPRGLAEVETSLVNYGIPDFSGTGPVAGKDRDEFARTLEAVIRRSEPRLVTVAVVLQTNPEPSDRALRFRIDALLRADPAPEPVAFDSILEPASGTVAVVGEAG